MKNEYIDDLTNEEILQHFGAKGMKWGVRNPIKDLKTIRRTKMNGATKSVTGVISGLKTRRLTKMNSIAKAHVIKVKVQAVKKLTKEEAKAAKPSLIKNAKARVGLEIGSIKRERSWEKRTADIDNMKDKDIKRLTTRIMSENALKQLGTHKEYLKRDTMKTPELQKRVKRLGLEQNLLKQVNKATEQQRKIGKALAESAGTITMAAVTGGTGVPVKAAVKAAFMVEAKAYGTKIGVAAGEKAAERVFKKRG